MQFRLRSLLVVVGIVAVACAWFAPRLVRGKAIVTLESTVPGTVVCVGDRCIGKTPLTIYASELQTYLTGPEFDARGDTIYPMEASPTGLLILDNDGTFTKEFRFLVPEGQRDEYFSYLGPHGEGTMMENTFEHWNGGGWSYGVRVYPIQYAIHFRPIADNDGIIIDLEIPKTLPRTAREVPVTATIRNPTEHTFGAVEPSHNVSFKIRTSRRMEQFSQPVDDEGRSLPPGTACVVQAMIPREDLTAESWVVFAEVALRDEDNEPANSPVMGEFNRYSPGILVRFEP